MGLQHVQGFGVGFAKYRRLSFRMEVVVA